MTSTGALLGTISCVATQARTCLQQHFSLQSGAVGVIPFVGTCLLYGSEATTPQNAIFMQHGLDIINFHPMPDFVRLSKSCRSAMSSAQPFPPVSSFLSDFSLLFQQPHQHPAKIPRLHPFSQKETPKRHRTARNYAPTLTPPKITATPNSPLFHPVFLTPAKKASSGDHAMHNPGSRLISIAKNNPAQSHQHHMLGTPYQVSTNRAQHPEGKEKAEPPPSS